MKGVMLWAIGIPLPIIIWPIYSIGFRHQIALTNFE